VTRIRFTIGSLLVLVLFLGVAFAALREASEIWDIAILNLAITAFLVSILLAVHRGAAKRAFWLGFALFGSTYLALSLLPSVEPRLLTSKALVFLDSKVPGRPSDDVIVGQTWDTWSNSKRLVVQGPPPAGDWIATVGGPSVKIWSATTGKLASGWGGTTQNFIRIGHSLLALLAAWSGGLLSRRLYVRNRRSTATPSEPSASSLQESGSERRSELPNHGHPEDDH
jgi:hypothetical protein